MAELTHLDEKGRARMVDVSAKEVTLRRAVARGRLLTTPGTLRRILEGDLPKGDALAVARTAGIMAAKQTSTLIPLCHPLPIAAVEILFAAAGDSALEIESRITVTDRTGAEMEALTAVAVAGLTVYDMCKAVDRSMTLTDVQLVEKSGGRSGRYLRDEPASAGKKAAASKKAAPAADKPAAGNPAPPAKKTAARARKALPAGKPAPPAKKAAAARKDTPANKAARKKR